jgi:hypothetical protein
MATEAFGLAPAAFRLQTAAAGGSCRLGRLASFGWGESRGEQCGQFCEAIGHVTVLFAEPLAGDDQFACYGGLMGRQEAKPPSYTWWKKVSLAKIESHFCFGVGLVDVLATGALATGELPAERGGRNVDRADGDGDVFGR